MKKLYYIEEESFLRDLVETLCRADDNYEAFTADNGRDNLYFFNDLDPDFILIDWNTIESYESKLFSDLSEVSQIPVGLTKLTSQSLPENWLSRASIVLDKPLEAKSLLKNIFS